VLDAIINRAGDVEEDAQNLIVQSKINADAYNDRARKFISLKLNLFILKGIG
jgi:hypothetical protein